MIGLRFRIGWVVALAGLAAPALHGAAASSPTPLASLEQRARQSLSRPARLPLVDARSPLFERIDGLEPAGSGRVPNYLRAMATLPQTAGPFSHFFKTIVSSGALPSETKLGMALRISQLNDSAYTVAHVERLLQATDRGRVVLAALRTGVLDGLTPQEQKAIAYGDALTRAVSGLSDAEFQATRAVFNDAQVVEMSFTTSYFNYFNRLVEGLNLPVEAWLFDTAPVVLPTAKEAPARVSLVSDEEMSAAATLVEAANAEKSSSGGLGLGIMNSQRAMLNAPRMLLAWRNFGAATQQYASVTRQVLLQVSFAVSTSNGCRYCTLHQVAGLRRLGVDPAKLMAMEKDDSALTTSELAAVTYARKLTTAPAGTTDADFGRLRAVFKDAGALEVLLQTCNFAFMNRFTDGLRLPSEDEAVRVYQETYGRGWQRKTAN